MAEEKMFIPQDVKDEVEKMAKEDNVSLDLIKEYMREEYFDEVLVGAFPDPKADNGARARQALLAARSRIASEKGDEDTEYKAIILNKGPVEAAVSKKGNEYTFRDIHGIFAKDGEKPEAQKVRLFGDAVQQVDEVPEKKMIQVNLSEKNTEEWGLNLSANKLFWKDMNKDVDIRKMFLDAYGDKKTVNEAEFSRGQREGDEDSPYKKVLVECRVKNVSIGESKKSDFKYVTYTVYSDEDGPEKVGYVRAPLSMAVCDVKSLMWVVAVNEPKNEDSKNDNLSLWADIIFPVIQYPLASHKLDSMIENAVQRKKTQQNIGHSNNRIDGDPEDNDVSQIEEVDDGDGWGDL